MKKMLCAIVMFGLCGLVRVACGEDFYVIPFKTDPAIVVDGVLDDWANVPNAIVLNTKDHVTFGGENWKGPDELGGVIRLSWREGGLYIAAEVTKAAVNQPYRGADIWKGDHVNLWMDLTPGQEPERTMFGRGQFHVVFSPGNLGGVKGDEKVTPPEIHVYRPEGLPQEGGEIASRRTDKGYIIEAFLPWSRVSVSGVKMNQDANFEVAISAAFASPPRQEMLMTYGVKPWVYSRARMLPCVFGDGNGRGAAPVRSVALLKEGHVDAGKTLEVAFDAPAIPAGKDPYVFFEARIASRTVGGWRARAMRIELNGTPVEGKQITNRPASSMSMNGSLANFIAPDGSMSLPYAPSARAFDDSPQYALIGVKGCEFEFDLAGMLKEGKNTLVFRNQCQASAENALQIVVDRVELRVKAPPPPPPPPKAAPTGPLADCAPATAFPKTFSALEQQGAKISFTVSGESYAVQSRFSAPDGKWYTGSSPFYEHSRKIIAHDEYIEVRDTFKNLKDEPVPVMQEHACDFGARMKHAWLGGYEVHDLSGRKAEAANPSAFATSEKAGVGMLPNNDEFLVHVEQTCGDGALRLADRSYVLDKGATYTATWFILPVPRPEFWDFINQARRARDVNFPLKWTFAFMTSTKIVNQWTDAQYREYIGNKSANFVVASNNLTRVQGRYPRCTELYSADLSLYRKFFERIRKLYPDGSVKTGMYFHCFLDTTPANAERFKADRALDAAGKQIDYGGEGAYMKEYIPFLGENNWGAEIAKWLDLFMGDDLKVDGIFWDEFSHSRGEYVYNFWDHCSGDIDPKTFQLQRTKGSVTLLSLPFRLKMVKRILSEGRPFVINGAPLTRTMLDQKFMAFTETGSITNCRLMLLSSPVALGDHLTERVEADAYNDMLMALDLGCLYSWYTDAVYPTHKTLTEYMFPFTPIELHEGYVIGKERILTNRSGLFGWGDKSDFTAHVFDRNGKETSEVKVPKVAQDGATFAEVRIGEGYSAAIVRQP